MKTHPTMLALAALLFLLPLSTRAETRMIPCRADKDDCWWVVAKIARESRQVLVSLDARRALLLAQRLEGVRLTPMPNRFRRLFCLVADDKAVLGGWLPTGKAKADIAIIDSPHVVEALRAKLTTGKGSEAPGVWFPETGSREAWRRISLPRKKIFMARPILHAAMAQALATLAKSGVTVSVETSRGTPKNLIEYLDRAGARVTVEELPPSRYRRFITEVDGKTILGLPGEALVLAVTPKTKIEEERADPWKGVDERWKEKLLDLARSLREKIRRLVDEGTRKP